MSSQNRDNFPRPHEKKLKETTKRGHHKQWELEEEEKKNKVAQEHEAKKREAQKGHEEIRQIKSVK